MWGVSTKQGIPVWHGNLFNNWQEHKYADCLGRFLNPNQTARNYHANWRLAWQRQCLVGKPHDCLNCHWKAV